MTKAIAYAKSNGKNKAFTLESGTIEFCFPVLVELLNGSAMGFTKSGTPAIFPGDGDDPSGINVAISLGLAMVVEAPDSRYDTCPVCGYDGFVYDFTHGTFCVDCAVAQ